MAASRFVYRRRILFHETDMAGIVHFSNFFKYMEEAEHAFVRSVGLSIHDREHPGGPIRRGWPRVKATCDFHAPLVFEEQIDIEVLVAEVRQRSIRYRFHFWKNPDAIDPQDRIRAATGEIAIVRVEGDRDKGTMKAIDLPDDWRLALAPVEVMPE